MFVKLLTGFRYQINCIQKELIELFYEHVYSFRKMWPVKPRLLSSVRHQVTRFPLTPEDGLIPHFKRSTAVQEEIGVQAWEGKQSW